MQVMAQSWAVTGRDLQTTSDGWVLELVLAWPGLATTSDDWVLEIVPVWPA